MEEEQAFRLVAGTPDLIELPFLPGEHLLWPWEVAELFGVDGQTVHDWTTRKGSKLAKIVVWTPGGHARYPAHLVMKIREELYATD